MVPVNPRIVRITLFTSSNFVTDSGVLALIQSMPTILTNRIINSPVIAISEMLPAWYDSVPIMEPRLPLSSLLSIFVRSAWKFTTAFLNIDESLVGGYGALSERRVSPGGIGSSLPSVSTRVTLKTNN